jgi:hypothetical protein
MGCLVVGCLVVGCSVIGRAVVGLGVCDLVVNVIDFASVGVFVGDGTLNLILCPFDDFDAPGSFATFDIVV